MGAQIIGFILLLLGAVCGGSFGLPLAYAINYGAQIATGGIGPLLIHQPEELGLTHGHAIVAGVVVCIVGVIVCGRAGILKSRAQADGGEGETVPTGSKLMKGEYDRQKAEQQAEEGS